MATLDVSELYWSKLSPRLEQQSPRWAVKSTFSLRNDNQRTSMCVSSTSLRKEWPHWIRLVRGVAMGDKLMDMAAVETGCEEPRKEE